MPRPSLPLVSVLLLAASCSDCSAPDSPLKDPARATERAPDVFHARFDTTAGEFRVECRREWAPNGVDRFYNLLKLGFFDDVAFFRVVKQPRPFVAQFGIHGDPSVSSRWIDARIPVDTPARSNTRGTISFAMGNSPDTRTTQVFVNLSDNPRLDGMGFAPICEVLGATMSIVDKISGEYGESPDQGALQSKGNAYLKEKFPKLDYVKTARIEEPAAGPSAAPQPSSSASP